MTEKGRRGTLFLWCYTEQSFPWRDQANQDIWELKEETPQLSENSVLHSGISGIHIKPGKLNTDTGRHQPRQQVWQFWGKLTPGQVTPGRKPRRLFSCMFCKTKKNVDSDASLITTLVWLEQYWFLLTLGLPYTPTCFSLYHFSVASLFLTIQASVLIKWLFLGGGGRVLLLLLLD